MSEIRSMYRTLMDDHFPDSLTVRLGDQTLSYRKRAWKLPDEGGTLVEKGCDTGEPRSGGGAIRARGRNLTLGACAFIEPGLGLVSALREEHMLQAGKHPGKIN